MCISSPKNNSKILNGSLSKLEVVRLSENNLAGHIPAELEILSKLGGFWLFLKSQIILEKPKYLELCFGFPSYTAL